MAQQADSRQTRSRSSSGRVRPRCRESPSCSPGIITAVRTCCRPALFKAARVWPRIESNPEAYVRRILYNENISWWRRRKVDRDGSRRRLSTSATAGGA